MYNVLWFLCCLHLLDNCLFYVMSLSFHTRKGYYLKNPAFFHHVKNMRESFLECAWGICMQLDDLIYRLEDALNLSYLLCKESRLLGK